MRIVSWNLSRSPANWAYLAADPATAPDVALLQEAVPATSSGARRFGSAVVKLTDRGQLTPIPTVQLGHARTDALPVSRPGSLAAAELELPSGERITVVSLYAALESPPSGDRTYADASAHRLISDLSVLTANQTDHRIIAAGDLNLLNGYGEGGSKYWRERYLSVFARMEAIGLPFVGPQHPNGHRAVPWPTELPLDSKNVPTFRTQRGDASTATRQLDFVFASESLRHRLRVRALNGPSEWGPSDHCRIAIELDEAAS